MSSAPREATGRNSSAELHGLRVLVVDDHEDARELVALMLERAGAAVERVDSAEMARSVLAKEPLDIIVSDIGMPIEDGYELIRKVRRGEVGPNIRAIPALAVTAFSSEKDRNQALIAGFQEHLAKPVDSEKLVAAVARIVGFAGAR